MPSDLRIAFLTNLIAPYNKPLFQVLTLHYPNLRFFISTAMEPNRPWLPEWSGLDVVRQRGISMRRTWRHASGFAESASIHFPIDTITQLARFQPDIIVSIEMGFRTLLALAYARFHPQCRLLIWSEVTHRTESGRGKLRRAIRRFLCRRAHAFLAFGPDGVRYIESLGAAPGNIFQTVYGMDLAPFTSLPIERDGASSTRLLYTGQFIERKGLQPFLEALAQWASHHPLRLIEFNLVGGGPLAGALQSMPMPPNVKLLFSGSVQYHSLRDFYAASGIFVLPTLADTWGLVVNEALASGLPVLGSLYSQAVQQMVENDRNGWTFRPDHQPEMYTAIHRALSATEAELNLMRARARLKAQQFTPENTASIIQTALDALTGNG
jgi:glycosyltransferase involved in cell wall biosynthesis